MSLTKAQERALDYVVSDVTGGRLKWRMNVPSAVKPRIFRSLIEAGYLQSYYTTLEGMIMNDPDCYRYIPGPMWTERAKDRADALELISRYSRQRARVVVSLGDNILAGAKVFDGEQIGV